MASHLRENRLFLGNPGTGKSTLINCLIGNRVFQSGVSWGDGLTRDFQRFESDGIVYMDTPGLADKSIIEQAARAITTALKQSGSYKLFFMVRLQSGRVVSEDLSTIESVLDSIDLQDVAFSVIINNISNKMYSTLMTRGREFDAVAALINSGRYATMNICLIPTFEELVEEANQVVELPKQVTNFIERVAPVNCIMQTKVKSIEVQSFQQQTDKIRKELEAVRRDNLELLDRIAEMERNRHVYIDVDDLPAYPSPSASYVSPPSTPPAKDDECMEQCLGIFCCCVLFGPLGIFCFFIFCDD
jgi:tRNA U34 5-carboxymethylaminomethyl modifying GTPase MnmE/TrmE